ncbi:hypothetical protein G6514_000054 [Epicoccum nigrum]|nr:hypothetical protein G6514_000054 [Epicoccum nigrum]
MSDNDDLPGPGNFKLLHAAIAAANATASAANAAASAATAAADAAKAADTVASAVSDPVGAATNAAVRAASAAAVVAANFTHTTSTLSSPTTSDQPFRFIDLPTELRLQIYGYLVIVGKVFYKPDDDTVRSNLHRKDFRAYRKPDLSILRVSKAVSKEAEEIYLSQNLFVLPVLREDHFDDSRSTPLMFSEHASKHIKHISVGISAEMPKWMRFGHAYTWAALTPGVFDQCSREERLRIMHSKCYDSNYWVAEMIVTWIDKMVALKTIELDLLNAYCPFGCCRKLDLVPYLPRPTHLERIRLLGLRSKKEEQYFVVKLFEDDDLTGVGRDEDGDIYDQEKHDRAVMEEAHKLHHITFGTEDDPWESWKIKSEGELQGEPEDSDMDMEDS